MGLSLIILLGAFSGGSLLIDGVETDAREKWRLFDGRVPHSSADFSGERWSIILFPHTAWEACSPELRADIRELGFSPPGAPSVPSPVDADTPTSDEEDDGSARPKLGSGFWGRGPPILTRRVGVDVPVHDGGGPCPTGRRPIARRRLPTSDRDLCPTRLLVESLPGIE